MNDSLLRRGFSDAFRRRPPLSWVALACSVLLTLVAWDVSRRSISGRLQDQFVVRSEQVALAILRRMDEHESVLRGGVALFLASDDVTREEFRRYYQHLELERFFPGVQGLGFAKLVHPSALAEFVASVRREGFSRFDMVPLGERKLYTPIQFIEPFGGRNLRAFGFDMFSEQRRREAMQHAWRTRRASASGILHLVQETPHDRQPGFLLYLPVFRALSSTSQERKEELLGFVFSPLRVHDLMRGILGHGPTDIDYALFEEGLQRPFFDSRVEHSDETYGELTRERPLNVAGRTWTLRFWSRGNFERWVSRREPYGVLLAGMVINLLLLYILGASASLQRRATALAREMTHELELSHAREQDQMRSSLKEKETLLKEIHHRVKNNLQVVSSLLSLQRSYTHDERALEPLVQSQQRVLAMAALHEFLYQSKDLSRVDTKAYLTHLVSVLAETHGARQRIALTLEIDEVALDVDHAIPCGLITNELVSNAFKYAYPGGRSGSLTVALRQHGGDLTLRVEDDGPGLPPGQVSEVPSTLGLQLVQLLTQQLGGDLTVSSPPGAKFVITFPFAARSNS